MKVQGAGRVGGAEKVGGAGRIESIRGCSVQMYTAINLCCFHCQIHKIRTTQSDFIPTISTSKCL